LSYSIQSLQQAVASAQLLRAKQVAELLQIAMSTFYSWLKKGGRYYKPSLPQPIYLSNGRTPFWRLADLNAFISANVAGSPNAVKGDALLPAAKMSEIVEPAPETNAVGDSQDSAAPMRSANFKEFVFADGQKVQMRIRPRVIEINPSAFSD
jgi:predicted DNA-binding transcriptional regulator AlpA